MTGNVDRSTSRPPHGEVRMAPSGRSSKRYFFVFLVILCGVVGALGAGALDTFQDLGDPTSSRVAKVNPHDEFAP